MSPKGGVFCSLVAANADRLTVAVTTAIAAGDTVSGTKAAAHTEPAGQIAGRPLGPIVLQRGMVRFLGQFVQKGIEIGTAAQSRFFLRGCLDAAIQQGSRQHNGNGTDDRCTLHDELRA